MDAGTRPAFFDFATCFEAVQALLSAQRAISRSLDLQTVAQAVADQSHRLTGASTCLVYLPEGDRLVISAHAGDFPERLLGISQPVGGSVVGQVFQTCQSQVTSNLGVEQLPVQPAVLVPLNDEDSVVGVLAVTGDKLRAGSQTLLEMLSPGATQALDNAYCYVEAQRKAVLAERRRMARSAHATLSGILFSASLIAEVLPRIWERSPSEGRIRMEELRQITRSAVVEIAPLTELPREEG